MEPINRKPSPVKTNRFGMIVAAALLAATTLYAIYYTFIPSPLPPQ
jgi:hypothetical protein